MSPRAPKPRTAAERASLILIEMRIPALQMNVLPTDALDGVLQFLSLDDLEALAATSRELMATVLHRPRYEERIRCFLGCLRRQVAFVDCRMRTRRNTRWDMYEAERTRLRVRHLEAHYALPVGSRPLRLLLPVRGPR